MKPLKLIVSGPVGAGKTTFIQSLSEIPVVETDEWASESIGKQKTTVALDFGALELGGVPIHLWGTPGQERFSFMWDVLAEGALGLILLAAGDRPQDLPRARNILDYITSRHSIPFIVGVTRQDLPRTWEPEEVADYFSVPRPQVVGLNATSVTDASMVLIKLLNLVRGKLVP